MLSNYSRKEIDPEKQISKKIINTLGDTIGYEDPNCEASDGNRNSAADQVKSLIVDSWASPDPTARHIAIAKVAKIATTKAGQLQDRTKQKEALEAVQAILPQKHMQIEELKDNSGDKEKELAKKKKEEEANIT